MERFWPEINCTVNYPVKACLVDMEEKGDFDIDDELQKFCVSWFTLQVIRIGTSMAVGSWNYHCLPGIVY